jgi:hypothetical protein
VLIKTSEILGVGWILSRLLISSWHTVGLKANGTVVAVGLNEKDLHNIERWHYIGQFMEFFN